MENNNQESPLTNYVVKYSGFIKTCEKIAAFVFIAGLLLHLLKVQNTEIILIGGAVLTAIVYFFLAFDLVDTDGIIITGILNSPGFLNFIYKLTFLSISISILSSLGLVIKGFPAGTLVNTSGITLIIVLFFSIITKINDRTKIYNQVFYFRIVPVILLVLYMANYAYHWID